MPEILDTELLYRGIIVNPLCWDFPNNRPSSAAFKDSKGVSVDRDGEREEHDISSVLKDRLTLQAIVRINAKSCRELQALPVAKPLNDNEFHAEIHDSDCKITLSSGKARRIAITCEHVWRSHDD